MYSQTNIIKIISLIGIFALAVTTVRAQCSACLGDSTLLGQEALLDNETGTFNTAIGGFALLMNTSGSNNTAVGSHSLSSNGVGNENTAIGVGAMTENLGGDENTVTGAYALGLCLQGNNNTVDGFQALQNNVVGSFNTAEGSNALHNTTGSSNTAIGNLAGINLTTGSNNVDIANGGVAGESNTIRIGTTGTQTATFIAGIRGTAITGVAVGITADGQLGVKASSARFKESIKPMDKASEAIFSLKPVTFRYKKELDPEGLPQFGLVAEQVAKVDSDLVVSDERGKPFTVRYEEVNAMLLNEFLKEHRKVEEQAHTNQEQDATITDLKSAVSQQESANAEQQKEIQALTEALKAQAVQIQKVSEQIKTHMAPRVVVNN